MTDYIKREDAIERLSYHTDFVQSIYVCDGEEMLYKQSAIKEISDIPSADVRGNVKGEWIIKEDIVPINFMDGYVETERCVCSNCGYEPTYAGRTIFPTTRTLLFCPNCGADMRGEANE